MVEPKVIKSPGVGEDRPEARLYYGQDVRESLRQLGDKSVHAVCTSPPYWGLRDYGVEPSVWGGAADCTHDWQDSTCSRCGAWRGQLGLEPTPELYVQHLVEVFREVRRVLRDDGTLWLNLGDCYVKGRTKGDLLKVKDLIGVPWRTAFALREDGWYLRSCSPWIKGNILPEPVSDRYTSAHEYIFMLVHPNSDGVYYYDIESTRIPHKMEYVQRRLTRINQRSQHMRLDRRSDMSFRYDGVVMGSVKGRNRRTTDAFNETIKDQMVVSESGEPLAFVVNPRPYRGAHFATWPPKLVEPMVLSSTKPHVIGLERSVVLDPFSGSATTGVVALGLGRDYVGLDLNRDYLDLAVERLTGSPEVRVEVPVEDEDLSW